MMSSARKPYIATIKNIPEKLKTIVEGSNTAAMISIQKIPVSLNTDYKSKLVVVPGTKMEDSSIIQRKKYKTSDRIIQGESRIAESKMTKSKPAMKSTKKLPVSLSTGNKSEPVVLRGSKIEDSLIIQRKKYKTRGRVIQGELRQAESKMTNLKPAMMSTKKLKISLGTDDKFEPVVIRGSKIEDSLIIQRKKYKTRGRVLQGEPRQAESKMTKSKPAMMSTKKLKISLSTDDKTESVVVSGTNMEDTSTVQRKKYKTRGRVIQGELEQAESSMTKSKPAMMSIKKPLVSLSTDNKSEPVVVLNTKIEEKKYKTSDRIIQGEPRQTKSKMTKSKPTLMSTKKLKISLSKDDKSEPVVIRGSKIEDSLIIQRKKFKTRGRVLQGEPRQAESKMTKSKPAMMSTKKLKISLSTDDKTESVVVSGTNMEDTSTVQRKKYKTRGRVIQGELEQAESSMTKSKPAMMSIKKPLVSLSTDNKSEPVVVLNTKIEEKKYKTSDRIIQGEPRQTKSKMTKSKPTLMSTKKLKISLSKDDKSEPVVIRGSKIEDSLIIQRKKFKTRVRVVQGEPRQAELKMTKSKPSLKSTKKLKISLSKDDKSEPVVIRGSKIEDSLIIQRKKYKTRVRVVQGEPRQAESKMTKSKPSMSTKKLKISLSTDDKSEPVVVSGTNMEDSSIVQRKKYKTRVRVVQGEPRQAESKMTKSKPAMMSTKKLKISLSTDDKSEPVVVSGTNMEDSSIVQRKKYKTSGRVIQGELEQAESSMTKLKPVMMSINKPPVSLSTDNKSEPVVVSGTNMEDSSIVQRKKYKTSGRVIQGELEQAESSMTKSKPAMMSIKKPPVSLNTDNKSKPVVVLNTKMEDSALIRKIKYKTSGRVLQGELRQAESNMTKSKPAMMSIKKPPVSLITDNKSEPVVVPNTKIEDSPLIRRIEYKARVITVQDKSTQTNTNETRRNPPLVSIKNDPTCSITNNGTISKVPVVVPGKKNEDFGIVHIKKLQNSEEAILETLRENNSKYDPKPRLLTWLLLNKPRCSTIDEVNLPAISDHPYGKIEDSKYEIDRTITDQNKFNAKELNLFETLRKSINRDKGVQDNRTPTNTNQQTNPAPPLTIHAGANTVYKLYILPMLAPKNGEKNLENRRRIILRNETRRVVTQENPRQTDKNKLGTKPGKMDEKEIDGRKRIRKLRHSDKGVQDNRTPTNTNQQTNPVTPSTINEGAPTVYKLYILPVLKNGEKMLENDQKRKLQNENRRVQIKENPRRIGKNKLRTKPEMMSIENTPSCSTTNHGSESTVDLSMDDEEFELREHIRQLKHRLDFPNGSRENLTGKKNKTPCSIKRYVSEPDFSLPNWRMEYLERDTYRIVQNDVKCVSNVDQFLKTIFI